MEIESNDYQELKNLLCDVYQLLTGWHADGTAWTEWDESVRKRVLELQTKLESELAVPSKKGEPNTEEDLGKR